jgi:hypothetical protein
MKSVQFTLLDPGTDEEDILKKFERFLKFKLRFLGNLGDFWEIWGLYFKSLNFGAIVSGVSSSTSGL